MRKIAEGEGNEGGREEETEGRCWCTTKNIKIVARKRAFGDNCIMQSIPPR